LYCSPNIAQQAWEGTNAHTILVSECDEKIKLGESRHRWEDNIKLFIKETGYVNVDWINLAQVRNQ
jgi:hypothetical protein